MIFIEAGINHFGSVKEAKLIVNFFLKSKFKHLTFMCHSENFYKKYRKKGINFKLDYVFYKNLIKRCHEKNKKIGLSVCDNKTFEEFKDLNFDFFKLLSVSINNNKLIKLLKLKKKPIYISTGFNVSNNKIKKCISLIKRNEISLLHTPMSYLEEDLNFFRINELREKFKLPVGYSNHNNNVNNLFALSAYNPHAIFMYCKPIRKKKRAYPDDEHAFFLDELEYIRLEYLNCLKMHKNFKFKKSKVKIFKNAIKK
tara:strand:- start:1277 stop:2041 length:765 start_codon:yes stop_codon:yes gene_type:complete